MPFFLAANWGVFHTLGTESIDTRDSSRLSSPFHPLRSLGSTMLHTVFSHSPLGKTRMTLMTDNDIFLLPAKWAQFRAEGGEPRQLRFTPSPANPCPFSGRKNGAALWSVSIQERRHGRTYGHGPCQPPWPWPWSLQFSTCVPLPYTLSFLCRSVHVSL